jgi:hypothetical protein
MPHHHKQPIGGHFLVITSNSINIDANDLPPYLNDRQRWLIGSISGYIYFLLTDILKNIFDFFWLLWLIMNNDFIIPMLCHG